MFRRKHNLIEVLLAHNGGPFFAKKDLGNWSIPKGEPDENEDLLVTAIREFEEEVGFKPDGNFTGLGTIKQKGGKEVFAWAVESDLPVNFVQKSNTVTIEWPPNSGKQITFPEVDKVEFFPIEEARLKIRATQLPLIHRLTEIISPPYKSK